MWTDVRLSFAVLRDPLSWGSALVAVVLAVGVFILLAVGVRWSVLRFDLVASGWLEQVLGGVGAGVALLAGWFCFPALVSALIGLVVDPVATRLERRHAPELGPARAVGWSDQSRASLADLTRGISLNLMLIPVYFVPGLNVIAYLALNAWLLGNTYVEALTLRRLPLAEARAFRRANRTRVGSTGLVIAALFLLPGVNMVAPVLATAFTFHRFLRRPDAPLREALALRPQDVLPTKA